MQLSGLIRKYWIAVSVGLTTALVVVGLTVPQVQPEAVAHPEPTVTQTVAPVETPLVIPDGELGYEESDIITVPSPPGETPKPVAPAPVAPAPKAEAPAPVPAPVAPAPAPAPPPAAPAPAPAGTEYDLINAIQAKYNTYATAGTRWVVGPMPAGPCEGSDGCTETVTERKTKRVVSITVTIRPGQVTDYLVIHEIMHTWGIRDECEADKRARSIIGPEMRGHYC